MKRVYAKLPRTGLANRLFVWARALVYAELNDARLYVDGWGHVHVGPWLRGERSKRFYAGCFRYQGQLLQYMIDRLGERKGNRRIFIEPELESLLPDGSSAVFKAVPSKHDYFASIRDYRELIRNEFFNMLRPAIRKRSDSLDTIDIAVHVRRGDFGVGGFPVTHDTYFLETLAQLTGINPALRRIMLFSDAPKDELARLLRVPNVELYRAEADVLELIQMSKSRILVTSLASTFGYWAGFLSDADIILHPAHTYGAIRSKGEFEGSVFDLVEKIKAQATGVKHGFL